MVKGVTDGDLEVVHESLEETRLLAKTRLHVDERGWRREVLGSWKESLEESSFLGQAKALMWVSGGKTPAAQRHARTDK